MMDKPTKFDRDIVVIGAGAGGLVSSLIGSTVNAKVSLIEKHKMGGDCLNTGCVPSKALIRSAKFAHQARHADTYGFESIEPKINFAAVMARVHAAIKTIEPNDSVERYTELGVDCHLGEAKLLSPYHVQITSGDLTTTLSTRNIIIAAGAEPFVPPIEGLDQIEFLTSESLWSLTALPEKLVVLGGGPIGCELTQAFARLGSHVTQVEMGERLMRREDRDVSEFIEAHFKQEGVDVRTEHSAKAIVVEREQKFLICDQDGESVRIPFDQILVAVGRKARVSGYGLNDLDINLSDRGTIDVNEFLQTNYDNIFAVGDVAGPYQFTHTAAHMAWYASVNALFGAFKKFKVDYSVIPWATYTDPEVARVGLNEQDAKDKGIRYEVTQYSLNDLDRAITDDVRSGFVKVLSVPGKDRILGVTIVGEHAGDLIAEFVLAMKQGLGLNKILGTIHIYPTLSEANKYAAGEWKKAHKPEWVLSLLKRYFRWRRG